MSEGAYPLSLYRSGTAFEWDGCPTDCRIVIDEDDHLQAAEDGWQEAADYLASPDSAENTGPKRGRPRKVPVAAES